MQPLAALSVMNGMHAMGRDMAYWEYRIWLVMLTNIKENVQHIVAIVHGTLLLTLQCKHAFLNSFISVNGGLFAPHILYATLRKPSGKLKLHPHRVHKIVWKWQFVDTMAHITNGSLD